MSLRSASNQVRARVLRSSITEMSIWRVRVLTSFRGDAKHRTRNLEIPGLVLAHHPGMTESDCSLSLLAMTAESLRRQYRAFDCAEADAVAVALAPAAQGKRIAVFEKRPDDAVRELDRLGTVPADLQEAATLVFLRAADGAAPQEVADIHGAAG